MALDLDERPDNDTLPSDGGGNGNGENSWEPPGWRSDNSGYDEANPQSKSTPTLAEQELGANPNDGNESSQNQSEQDLQSPEDTVGKGYSGKTKGRKSNRKKIIAAVSAGAATVSIFGAVALLPSVMMKTITSKLSETFMGRANYAVQQRIDVYVKKYVIDVIGDSLRTCGRTIDKNCTVVADGRSLFGTYARNWRTNRIEEKLFNDHGLEFELDQYDSNTVKVFRTDEFGRRESLGEFGKNTVSRDTVKYFELSTNSDGILNRRHIRSVLSKKYGASKFCIIACDARDEFADAKLKGMTKLKLKIVAQVSEITSARMTAYLLCLSTGCSKADRDKADDKIVKEILEKTTEELVVGLAADINKYGTKNLTQLILNRTIDKLVLKVATKEALKKSVSAIPIVGQIYLGATIAELITVLDESVENREISKFLREVNEQESAAFVTQIINIQEDTQSFQSPVEDSFVAFQYLNGFSQSRLWQEMNGIEKKSTVECNDGVVLSGDNAPLVCPELNVQPTLAIEEFRNSDIVQTFEPVLNQYNSCIGGLDILPGDCPSQAKPRYYIKGVLDVIDTVSAAVGETLVNGLKKIPGVGGAINSLQDFIGKYATQFFGWLTDKLFDTVINPDAEDQLAFDQAAIGYDVLGNTFAKGDPGDEEVSGLGGVLLSSGQQATLDVAIAEKKLEAKKYQSVFERYFDTDNSDSLLASSAMKTATILPVHGNTVKPSLTAPNFIDTIASLFGVNEKASALTATDRSALFGVSQYGYPADDPALQIGEDDPALQVDPATLTPEKCAEYEELRESTSFMDDAPDGTGEKVYTMTNPCMLDEVVTDILTKYNNLDSEANSGSNGTSTATDLNCSGFTEVALNRTTAVPYSAAVSAQCETIKQSCTTGVADTLKILCSALEFDGVYYGNGYGRYSGANANEIYGFSSTSNNFGINAEGWIANRSEGLSPNNLLECSGLTSVALFRAFGYDGKNIGCSGQYTERNNPSLFRQLTASEIKPGDFLTKSFGCNSSTSGHIAIAASAVDASGNVIVYETNSWGKPVRFTQQNLARDFPGGWSRYIGPGS